jgi:hypothetical protein
MEVLYKEVEGIGQSTLKQILKSPQAFLKAKEKGYDEEDKAEHFVFGSMVDHLLLEDSPLEDHYHIMDAPKITDAIKAIVKDLYGLYLTAYVQKPAATLADIFDKDIAQIVKYHNFYSNRKPETNIKTIREQGAEYFKSLVAAGTKTIVPREEYAKAVTCKAAVLSDPFVGEYFKNKKRYTLYKKVVISYTFREVRCKGEIDLVIIDHQKLCIIPVDIKTIGDSVYRFLYNFWKLRYDIQAASYVSGLQKGSNLINKYLEKGYGVSPFNFWVIDKEAKTNCFVYEAGHKDIYPFGMYGGVRSNGQKLEGFTDAIDRYLWHTKEDKWDYPREYYQNGGKLMIEP